MRIERRRVGPVDILSFTGEFDASKAPVTELDDLIEAGRKKLVCSFGGLRFITSPVIGHLVKAAKRLKGLGGEIVLAEPSKFMLATIRTLGLDQIFEVFPTDEEAIRHLSTPGASAGLLGPTAVSFGLSDAPAATAVGRLISIHADGIVLEYPMDPDRVRIDPEELRAGRRLGIRFQQPFLDRERSFEMEAEIVAAADAPGGGRAYRLRYTRISERDREMLARLADGAPPAP